MSKVSMYKVRDVILCISIVLILVLHGLNLYDNI